MKKTLTKADIVETIYENTGHPKSEVQRNIEILLNLMKEAIKKDSELLVSGFGKFESYAKQPRKGRNPQTGETIVLPSRRVVVFRLSGKLREELNALGEKPVAMRV